MEALSEISVHEPFSFISYKPEPDNAKASDEPEPVFNFNPVDFFDEASSAYDSGIYTLMLTAVEETNAEVIDDSRVLEEPEVDAHTATDIEAADDEAESVEVDFESEIYETESAEESEEVESLDIEPEQVEGESEDLEFETEEPLEAPSEDAIDTEGPDDQTSNTGFDVEGVDGDENEGPEKLDNNSEEDSHDFEEVHSDDSLPGGPSVDPNNPIEEDIRLDPNNWNPDKPWRHDAIADEIVCRIIPLFNARQWVSKELPLYKENPETAPKKNESSQAPVLRFFDPNSDFREDGLIAA